MKQVQCNGDFKLNMLKNGIKKFDELIYQYTGPTTTCIRTDFSNFTTPGENYCSLLFKIDVTLKNENGKEEMLHTVAKCRNKKFNSHFGNMAPLQFKHEIAFYTEIVPVLEEFIRNQGVENMLNFFPKLIAARRNLHGKTDEIDENAVILLENLSEQGKVKIESIFD